MSRFLPGQLHRVHVAQFLISRQKQLGLKSGIGLVVANMVGAGVFMSAGFMAQDLTPSQILFGWVVGAVLALCGVVAYAEVARLIPESGGEYRYISTLWHPFLGYLAGWSSLLVGFSAPIAIDAYMAGAFANKLHAAIDPNIFGVLLIVVLTVAHAIGLRTSTRVQNVLFAVKLMLLVAFIGVGVVFGRWAFPTWNPVHASAGFPFGAFAGSLFFIAFAFSGWNAAVYAAEEFERPGRDVPRAMIIGCAAVGLLYLVLNYVFVANLTPTDDLADWSVKTKDQVTLGHVVMSRLIGEQGASIFSGIIVLLFMSAMSAMMLVGPRVCAAMAADGVLPAGFKAPEGKPPVCSVLLQGAIAIALVLAPDVRGKLEAIGALLVLFAALTVTGLFRARMDKMGRFEKPSVLSLGAAAIYGISALWMLYFGFFRNPNPEHSPVWLLLWAGTLLVVSSIAYAISRTTRIIRPILSIMTAQNRIEVVRATDESKIAILYRMVMPEHVCPWGLKAKYLLERQDYTVEDHWLRTNQEDEAFKIQHDVKTTPQAFIGGERVGGYEDLRKFFGLKVADPEATSYTPVLAVFAAAAVLALALSSAVFNTLLTV
ncbi:MAG TPA: amino acid permease, partial [Halioglobus sp.]